jgi:predicted DNA-binding mobile mystery protein A
MKNSKKLQIELLDRKLVEYLNVSDGPAKGWIHGVRTALKMSFRQLAGRLSITAQSAQEMEAREQNGNITLKSLRDVAAALNMRFIYGFVPRDGSLEAMIEKQANLVARKIVMRTDNTMKLEDQQVPYERVEKAIQELAEEIKKEMPRYLWD